MNIEHLKLFIRVANTQNISAAGYEMDLSPAVASSYINKLEKHLGVRLIHRTTRKIALTEEGIAFLPHAEGVLTQIMTAEAAVGVGNHKPSGTLRVAAPASFGRMHIVPALETFLTRYPDLTIDLRLSDTIIDLVEGGFDIAIRNAELKDSTLIARMLAPDHRILCASPKYIAQHGTPKTPHELTKHACINLIGLENWTFETNKTPITIKTKGVFRTDNGEAIRDAAINHLGITVSSTWSIYEHLNNGELIQVLPEHKLYSKTNIWAVYPSSHLLAPKVRAFIDYFAQQFNGIPYWDKKLDNDKAC